jgi:thiamine-phosphate pyrophosphorylase
VVPDFSKPNERLTAVQIIDVNVNRASEGLRVVEEYCRFVLAEASLTARCKEIRDRLHAAIDPVSRAERLMARDTANDIGTSLEFSKGLQRDTNLISLEQIAVKNGERVKEALRVIEEYCKALYPEVAGPIGMLRYQWYSLEQDCQLHQKEMRALADSRLYVLIDGGSSECAFVENAKSLIEAGVHAIQLRDKKIDDRTLLARARLLRRVIDEADQCLLFIMNDRPDLSVLAKADGVHVGQDELGIRDVRRIVGPQMLVGVSTHSVDQAREAVRDGADYIGCGPTFQSETKHFEQFPGLDFLKQIAGDPSFSIPAFAIGGITLANLPQVLAAGFTRVAVSAAITAAENPAAAAKSFLTVLRCDSKDQT